MRLCETKKGGRRKTKTHKMLQFRLREVKFFSQACVTTSNTKLNEYGFFF